MTARDVAGGAGESNRFPDSPQCRIARVRFNFTWNTWTARGHEHPIGDSAEYLVDAALEGCACPCGGEEFEMTVGVSLYADSEDIRWLCLGCRCPGCGLTAVYGDWKNEFNGYQEFLARV